MTQQERLLFGFNPNDEISVWSPIDDVVMGGVSQSKFSLIEGGHAIFEGYVSFENNGGFASVRSAPCEFQLEGYRGIKLRVKGDGKMYKLRVKTDTRFDGIVYQQSFPAEQNLWVVHELPFSEFVPSFRGTELKDQPPLDPSRIQQFGLMITGRQEGAFRLEIDWIKAYK